MRNKVCRFISVFLPIIALVLLTSCKSITGPTPPVYPVQVNPPSAFIAPGTEMTFTATGGSDFPNFRWSVSGGADVVNTGYASVTIKAQNVSGVYKVTAESKGQTGEAIFEVKAVTTADIIGANPPAGSTLVIGQRVAVQIRYVAMELPAIIVTSFYDVNKNLIAGASSGENLTSSGVVTLQAGAGRVGHSQYLKVEIDDLSNGNIVYFSQFFDLPFEWK